VPKSLQQESDDPDGMDIDEQDDATEGTEHPVMVVCSGDLIEQVCSYEHSDNHVTYVCFRLHIRSTRPKLSFFSHKP
jgi:hypothetical protein